MSTRRIGTVPIVAALLFVFVLAGTAFQQRRHGFERLWGPSFRPNVNIDHRRDLHHRRPRPHPQDARAMIVHWNEMAIDATGLDHTPPGPDEERTFGEELGPGRSARAMAMVHIAVFDAVNAIAGGYRGFSAMPPAPPGTSMEAAVAEAAHDTLVAMFPSQADDFNEELAEDLSGMPNGPGKFWGVWLGRYAAAAILRAHQHDGSDADDPLMGTEYIPSNAPGQWRQDPISLSPIALGATWGGVKPFVISSGARYRVPPPPELTSDEYTEAYNEVKRLGGDGITTPTERTEEQTFIATFWAYDGTPSLCAPPRFYNQITMTIADQMHTGTVDLARLLALVNVVMADASIAVWESKFYYKFWRPITAIRESDPGTGPTGLGDGNPDTIGDISFTPLGAPASNLSGPNFTPPFPTYPSGHGGFGGAVFQILRRFYGTDRIAFTIVSDEWNGITRDNMGVVRPLRPRSYESFSQAEEENGQSRIYLGIHFAFDKTEAIAQGRRVADYVWTHAFMKR